VVGVTGFEPATKDAQCVAGKELAESGAGECNTFANTSLQKLSRVWPDLAPEVRAEILRLAGLSDGDEA